MGQAGALMTNPLLTPIRNEASDPEPNCLVEPPRASIHKCSTTEHENLSHTHTHTNTNDCPNVRQRRRARRTSAGVQIRATYT